MTYFYYENMQKKRHQFEKTFLYFLRLWSEHSVLLAQ